MIDHFPRESSRFQQRVNQTQFFPLVLAEELLWTLPWHRGTLPRDLKNISRCAPPSNVDQTPRQCSAFSLRASIRLKTTPNIIERFGSYQFLGSKLESVECCRFQLGSITHHRLEQHYACRMLLEEHKSWVLGGANHLSCYMPSNACRKPITDAIGLHRLTQ